LSTQCVDNFPVGEGFGEPDHVPEILVGETLAEFGGQPRRDRHDDPLPIPGSFRAENLGAEPVSDLPVEQDLAGIHRLRDRAARGLDQLAQLLEQLCRGGQTARPRRG
jgi:hypothetical protein